MRFILVVVTLVGVILYGFLNTPQNIGTATVAPRGTGGVLPTSMPATRVPLPPLTLSAEGILAQPVPTLTIPEPVSPQDTSGENSPEQPIPTLIIPEPAAQITPLPALTVTSAPESLPRGERHRNCDEPGCITWSYQILVPHTMNRWEVWEQAVGSSMMAWERFIHEVETVNPSLKTDGHMFKVGKIYLLPECVEMERH